MDLPRPSPSSPHEKREWDELALRHCLLRGDWTQYAKKRLQEFFDQSTWQFLPDPVVSFNPFRSFVLETSTLFNGPVTVHANGAVVDDERLGLDVLWALQQQTLEYVRGMNDCLVRRGWDHDEKRVTYTVVPTSCVQMKPNPRDPSQPCWVRYLTERHDIELDGQRRERWVWQEYDFIDPRNPRFVVWAVSDDGRTETDVTAQVLRLDGQDEVRPGNWQWWDRTGRAIWIWTAYHQRVGSGLESVWDNHEVVDGTLTASSLWTYWLGGFRDASWNQRWMLDCALPSNPNPAAPWVPANPMAVLQARSTDPTRAGQLGAFPVPFQVLDAATAIGNFMASLGLFMGLSSADTSVSATGLSRVSGFAIDVSRSGKRKIEQRMILPMSLGDRHNLAGSAQLANAYVDGPLLPERPRDYTVMYASTPHSPDEMAAELEQINRQVELGLLHHGDAIRRLRPELTKDQAEEYALAAATFRRRLEEAAKATFADVGLPSLVQDAIIGTSTAREMLGLDESAKPTAAEVAALRTTQEGK